MALTLISVCASPPLGCRISPRLGLLRLRFATTQSDEPDSRPKDLARPIAETPRVPVRN
jgi:hypothetical protein